MTNKEKLDKNEKVDWEYILRHNCLCCFWDDDDNDAFFGCLEKYEIVGGKLRFWKTDVVPAFDNCRPAQKSEVIFYEDKENK